MKLLPGREDIEVDVSPYFFTSPPCPCSPSSDSPESLMPQCPTPYSNPVKCSLLPTTTHLPAATGGRCESLISQKSKAERPRSILGGKRDVGGDALPLWPITAAPEGHWGMEVRRDEIDELFAPRSHVQTHLRAVLTESRGKPVLLMAVQHLSLPQPVCGEQIHIELLHHK